MRAIVKICILVAGPDFIVFRASGDGGLVQLAEVGPNMTSYRDRAVEADVVYRYADAAEGAQNPAQIQAEAGVSVAYHGKTVRSFTGKVVAYSAGEALLVTKSIFCESGSIP